MVWRCSSAVLALALRLSPVHPEESAMAESTLDQTVEPGIEPRLGRSVSLDQAAELLGVSRRTIYNRIREGRLVTIRTLGGSQRVLLDSVQVSKES
jgi:excisionase family DNA binding protein